MEKTHAFADESGARNVHAYDQPGTLMGQGTTGLEFLDQAPVDTLLIATGGGGLIGGMAAYVEDRARIVSVEPEMAPTLFNARAAGRPVHAPAGGIAADSLGPGQVGELMFPITQAFVDVAVTVPDSAIRKAWQLLWDELRIVVEPRGGDRARRVDLGGLSPGTGGADRRPAMRRHTSVVGFPE